MGVSSMKPTLANLKKRPALWFSVDPSGIDPRITMPDGTIWHYWHGWSWFACGWHEHAIEKYEFGGWL